MQDDMTTTPVGGSGQMFDQIADRYDLLNRIMSMGIDIYWRKQAVKALELGPDSHVMDLATGTGDVALEIAHQHADASVTGVDPSEGMMVVGRSKVAAKGLASRITLEVGDGQDLRFDDNTFQGALISFGIRNVPDRMAGLREMARVTAPGGKVVILEANEPQKGIMASAARFHMHHVIPAVGGLISSSSNSEYRYLQSSIQAFPQPDAFAAMMSEAGLVDVVARPMTFGVVTLFVGTAT